MPRKMTKAEKISQLDYQEKLFSQSTEELGKTLKMLQQSYQRRVASFRKKKIWSPAVTGAEEYSRVYKGSVKKLMEGPQASSPKRLRGKLMHEIAKYTQFFRDKSSTEKGAREIAKQQDIMLFGADKRGRPRNQLTKEERDAFWSAYNEYMNQNPTKALMSSQVQEVLADVMIDRGKGISWQEILAELQAREASEELSSQLNNGGFNVYSGRGNPFD